MTRAGLVARLNALARRIRAAGGTVIFVQHDGPEGDPHHPSQPGWATLPDLEKLATDVTVRKTACDAFLGTDLDDVLARGGIRKLVITGCATDYCVGHHRAGGTRARLSDDGSLRRPHDRRSTASECTENHRAPQRDLERFHRPRRSRADLRLRRHRPLAGDRASRKSRHGARVSPAGWSAARPAPPRPRRRACAGTARAPRSRARAGGDRRRG